MDTEQGRAGQGRAGQGRAGEGRSGEVASWHTLAIAHLWVKRCIRFQDVRERLDPLVRRKSALGDKGVVANVVGARQCLNVVTHGGGSAVPSSKMTAAVQGSYLAISGKVRLTSFSMSEATSSGRS